MSYTRPAAAAADLSWVGQSAYTRPAATTTDLSWLTGVTGTGAATVDPSAAATAAHGVVGVGAVTLGVTADAVGDYQSSAAVGVGAVTVDPTAAATASHGITGTASTVVDPTAAATAEHGIAGTASVTVGVSAGATGAHGIAGPGAATITFTAAAVATHLRYEVKGEVRQGGILVNRRVRAYLRSSGALVGEGDTTFGKFALNTGFAALEHYVVPINLDDAATDWVPPIANRVLSVLAQDV